MRKVYSLVLMLAVFVWSSGLFAAPEFNNITQGDLDAIIGDLSANTFHTTASPPPKPSLKFLNFFGLEAGVNAGVTQSPNLGDRDKNNSDTFPHASLFAGFHFPLGLALEASHLPEINLGKVKLKQAGGALAWAPTEVFFSGFPVRIGTRLHYSKVDIGFSQQVGGVDSTIKVDDTIWGGNVTVSKKLLGFEPYLGAGYLTYSGDISISGGSSTTFFNSALTTGTSAGSEKGSSHVFAGFNFSTLIFVLGAEYSRIYETNRFTAKLGVKL